MGQTAHFRGEGGVIWPMDLPLPEVMQDKLVKGYLVRVNADGSPYIEEADAVPEQAPPSYASKAVWVGYAVRVHGVSIDDAEAMTKTDLMETFGLKV